MSLASYSQPATRVSIGVGCHHHSVAIGLLEGHIIDEFEIKHDLNGNEGRVKS